MILSIQFHARRQHYFYSIMNCLIGNFQISRRSLLWIQYLHISTYVIIDYWLLIIDYWLLIIDYWLLHSYVFIETHKVHSAGQTGVQLIQYVRNTNRQTHSAPIVVFVRYSTPIKITSLLKDQYKLYLLKFFVRPSSDSLCFTCKFV